MYILRYSKNLGRSFGSCPVNADDYFDYSGVG